MSLQGAAPTPAPKAQAPWQRPRRQGGVCQRHLSLTSSITGHHGNTHDSTQEGLPVQPSFSPSIGPQLSPNWKPPFLWDWRSPNSLFQLQVPGSTRQRLLDPCACSNPQNTHTNTQQHPSSDAGSAGGLRDASEPRPKASQSLEASWQEQTHAST